MVLSVGDILQLTRLAADLYTKGWVVARDAPQEFRDLVHELLLLKDVLFIVHRKVTRDDDGLYGDPTKRVLQQCFGALSDFNILVAKYEKLALSDRGHWFRRLQWSREQDSIRACQNKLQKYQQLLQLVLTPEGRTILSEESPDEAGPDQSIAWGKHFSSNIEDQSTYRDRSGTSFSQPTRTQTLDSAQTLVHSHNSPPPRLRESFSQARQRSNQTYLTADVVDPVSFQRIPTLSTEQSSMSEGQRSGEHGQLQGSFARRASDASVEGRLRQMSFSTIGTIGSNDSWGQSSGPTNFQPLEIPEQREKHECPEELKTAFLQSFDAIGNEILDESWIRVATWWLIKSQAIFRSINSTANHSPQDAFHDYSQWENTTSKDQAYVDLLKASWILDVLIRERKVAGDLTKSHTRKLVIDLMKALKSDLHHRQRDRSFGGVPATTVLLGQDLSLLESFEQTVEAKENEPRAMDDLTTSQRWITIDKDHGGFPNERILFRSFVNAQIGERHERSKSSNAPYIILLWTKAGESEIIVSLCNQRDTMNLSRKLTAEDLEFGHPGAETAHRDSDATALHLEFPSQSAEIKFLTASDFDEFRAGPKRFFDAVKGRDPRPGELTVFQSVLKSYRNANTTASTTRSSRSDSGLDSFHSCELRLYEKMDETCWKSIRRLVISSAADSKKFGSVSHWLPISNVRLQVEDSTVTVSWSDCAHLEKKSGGNYNPYYSFVYRPDVPNQKVLLLFNHSDDAQRFEDCILYLTETPPQVRLVGKIDSASAFQETRIYSLYDQDDPDRGYHGIVYAKKSPKTYHYSQICYIYRDMDFSFCNQNAVEIELQNVRAPHYISTRHKMLSRPKDSDAPPEFREVTWVSQPVQLTFSTDDDAVQFLSDLTAWRLTFYKQCAKLVTTDTSHFHKPKKTYKSAEISLWEKSASEAGSLTQLLVRLPEGDKPWLTARLESSGGGLGLPTGGVVELKSLAIQQGKDLDTKYMKANSEEVSSKSCWKFTITFKIPSDGHDFMMQSGLVGPFARGLGHGLGNTSSRDMPFGKRSSSAAAIHCTSPSLGELQESSHEHRSLRAVSSTFRNNTHRLWDDFRSQNPSNTDDPRHQSASSRGTQASASSASSGTTTATTVDNSLQGSRATSQDIDPKNPNSAMSSAMKMNSKRDLDDVSRIRLRIPVAVAAAATQIAANAKEKLTHNGEQAVRRAKEPSNPESRDIASPTPSFSLVTGERPRDPSQEECHMPEAPTLINRSAKKPKAHPVAIGSQLIRRVSNNKGDSPDCPLTPRRGGLRPQARLQVDDSRMPNLKDQADNEHLTPKAADVQEDHRDAGSDAGGNRSTKHQSFSPVAWCLYLLPILRVREAPLAAGKKRIRWKCACGSSLYDDFTEIRPGAAKEFELVLRSPSQQWPTNQHQPTYGNYMSGQPSITDLSETSNSAPASNANPPGPMSRTVYDPRLSNDRAISATIPCNPESKWLLVCTRAVQRPTSLFHLDVGSTTSDQQFFKLLRQTYVQAKKHWYRGLSFKRVRSIRFVQFELHPRDLVDVRKVPDMPPATKQDDYLYQPCDLLPPVGENLMTHLFHNPHETNEKAITYLRSPKKRKQKLAICQLRGTNIGWGIHLVEGWAITKLWFSALAIFSSSFVFAVAWSVLKHDVQGAFGVAGWLVGLATLGLGSFQAISQGD